MKALNQAELILRASVAALFAVYAFTLYSQWVPAHLSSEATQYRQLVSDTMSGFSIAFALQKICWALGNGLGIVGMLLLIFRSGYGLPALLLSAPVLSLAALLGSAPAAYPDVQSTSSLLLWCLSSATWGGVVVFAFLRRDILFVRRRTEDEPENPS